MLVGEPDPNKWVFQPIEARVAKHHIVTMEAVQDCIEEPGGRLMIFEPPGSAKSTYACVVATTWAMGKWPGFNTLMVSSSGIPIIRASKKARQVAKSAEFRNIWEEPTFLPKGSMAADEWALTNGSTMFAAGILGGIVGSRADLAIVDDPTAGREEADSERVRRKIKQAYEDDVLTRIKPNASIIIIQTRWHEDDLSGSILPEDWKGESGKILCRDGQWWTVLCIPAEADRLDDPLGRPIGGLLWPEWFPASHWDNFRVNPRTWSALFQQNPQPATGGQFVEEWVHRFNKTDLKGLEFVDFLTGDWAVTEKTIHTNPDMTVLGSWGIDAAGDLWLMDGWHGMHNPVTTIGEWMKLVLGRNPTTNWGETGQIRRAMEPLFKAAMAEIEKFLVMEWKPTGGDKVAKFAAFRGLAANRKVHVIKSAFGDWFIAQLCAFPYGRYDDAADMAGLAGTAHASVFRPEKPDDKNEGRVESIVPFTEQMWQRARDRDREEAARRKRFTE